MTDDTADIVAADDGKKDGKCKRICRRLRAAAAWFKARARMGMILGLVGVVTFAVVAGLGIIITNQDEGKRRGTTLVRQGDQIVALTSQTKLTAEQIKYVADYLKDCLDPKGKCNAQRQTDQAAAYAAIEKIVVLGAVICARAHPQGSLTELVACVEAGLR